MTDEQIKKKEIESALAKIPTSDFLETTKGLLAVLGYRSERTLNLSGNVDDFIQRLRAPTQDTETEREFRVEVESIKPVFQVTDDEINASNQIELFESPAFDTGKIKSFLFFAVKLKDKNYPRGKYAQFTREINKRIVMPVVALFRVEDRLTIGFVRRRSHKLNPKRAVLEQVTLIKDIALNNPHRAHLDILFELSLEECAKWMVANKEPENFDGLLTAWLAQLDTEELNKRFFSKIANWYFWAVDQVTFPDDADEEEEVRNATSIIRLLTRLIFVWFIKEKGLVPDALFNQTELDEILINTDPHESTYYKAILQNLFFATLNQEMNTAEKPNNRKFRGEGRQHYNITSLYRYKRYFTDPDKVLRLFEAIPFLNGGLFECLDVRAKDNNKVILRVDGFSDRDDSLLHVPNELFFSDEQTVDLNKAYGTKKEEYKVQGLIDTLDRYKFTVTENTPIEEEVALDPELLGKVFENLLAAYNPQTQKNARKQTGSFYTPREIVNYMTDESLVAYLKNELRAHAQPQGDISVHTPPSQLDFTGQAEPVQTELDMGSESRSDDEQKSELEKKLRNLLAYNDEPNPFNQADTETLIKAIDSLKILDPACGSGAFPMGVLHKLVFILGKLDPRNDRWRQRQIDRVESTVEMAEKIDDSTVRDNTIRDLEGEIVSINEAFERNELDYGRKLYLIENCIYGVDIQPIATQIAKLRFFISLIVDQQLDDSQANRGVRPLPNLETKFVAANTLLDVEKPEQLTFRNPEIDRKEKELADVRRKHFTARTPRTKAKYRNEDTQIRTQIGELLKAEGFPHETTEKIVLWDLYDQNATADWFDPEWMFSVTDGFDTVIGNPPYIQLQKEGGKLGRLYAPCNFDSFIRTGDIYCLFYEKANQLLKNGGHICFITSNKWMRAAYGKKLRDYLIGHTQPVQLLDMGPGVFDATVDTNILLLQNTRPDTRLSFTATTIKSDFDPHTGNIAQYLNDNGMAMALPPKDEAWTIRSPAELALKHKIEDVGKPLKDWDINIYFGIKTGCNEAFIIDKAKRDELIAQDPKSTEIIKPLLRGRDIERYHVQWAGLYLLFIPWHFPLHEDSTIAGASQKAEEQFKERYPGIYNHLLQHQDILSKRNKSETGIRYEWYALQRCANTYYPEFEKEKIVWKRVGSILRFAYSEQAMLCLDSTCIATGKRVPFLTAVLNSRLSHYQLFELAPKTGTGDLIVSVQALEPLLVPPITETNQHLATQIENLADQILTAKRTNPNADVSDRENEIDQIVYLLYGLTTDEIAIVEGKE